MKPKATDEEIKRLEEEIMISKRYRWLYILEFQQVTSCRMKKYLIGLLFPIIISIYYFYFTKKEIPLFYKRKSLIQKKC